MSIPITRAILAIDSTAWVGISSNDIDRVIWHDGNPNRITKSQITEKLVEFQAAEPIRLLRIKRNQLLAETDWWAVQDRVMTNDQQVYRQQLRDLPATASPALDKNGQLTGVTWPEKPVGDD